ncbi:Voltage-dependent calcium channel type A subunit alpha-1 [Orchesella cincta]|uniref:Voltage-dependent calcium channel type A subunit alpha-1 n=1 Tax=Orchesella cincta TaxID=48709 RepID=A0A1D2NMH5_ORCCI|nr:Voltage-dependent calcium channel type A subunit alpha-1 [Orchesella cincta]
MIATVMTVVWKHFAYDAEISLNKMFRCGNILMKYVHIDICNLLFCGYYVQQYYIFLLSCSLIDGKIYFGVIELQDMVTDGKDGNASPLLDDKMNPDSQRRRYNEFDRESMQDMDMMREEDEYGRESDTMYLQPHHHAARGRRLRSRSPSPGRGGRYSEHEIGFSEVADDVVELVRDGTGGKRGRERGPRRKFRGEEFSLSPRFPAGYHDSALSPSTPEQGANNGFLPPR